MLNLNLLNPQQRQAVVTHKGPVLILAGAGTGKTRVITHRIVHMIQKGIAPGHILAVTFTNKAAREMKERVRQLVPRKVSSANSETDRHLTPALSPIEAETGEGTRSVGPRPLPLDSRPTICTFHSLGVRILRQHIEKLGYKRNFVIYSDSDQLGTIKKILSHISAKGEKTDPALILSLLSRYKNCGASSKAFADEGARAMAEHILGKYENALRACNAIDFDDLILLPLKLFREHPDVLEACREKYRYVMVDEYQDTNAAQFEMVHALTREHRNLCVVGDDDQSIYGWRGAEIANLLEMEKHYPEVKVIKLEQNYRSTNIILTAANAVIKNNLRRRGKQLWSDQRGGSNIRLMAFETDEEEAREVVQQIEFARVADKIPWGDQAILFRTNQQSRPLEMALRHAGVRYHLIGGQSYFDRREIRDFLAYLKVFLNPNDDVSLLRIANVPARGLSETTMQRLLAASQERHCSVFTAMRHTDVLAGLPSRARESIESFSRLIDQTREQLQQEETSHDPQLLQSWAERFLGEIGYFDELRRSEKNPETAENRVRNLNDLVALMDGEVQLVNKPFERLESFLEEITLDNDREEEKESAGDAVTLITMHSCKGLEFPHVYIVGLEDGLLPHSRSKVEGTMDEERRLFYVAITRAKQSLTISYALGRKKYGQVLPCHPSPFLQELPEELIEDENLRRKKPVAVETGRSLFAAMKASLE